MSNGKCLIVNKISDGVSMIERVKVKEKDAMEVEQSKETKVKQSEIHIEMTLMTHL